VYVVCGLTVETSHPVRGLLPAHSTSPVPDVVVRFDARPAWADAATDPRAVLRSISSPIAPEQSLEIAWVAGGAGVRFRHGDGSVYYVDAAGENVWAEWTAALTLDDVGGYLDGSILGYVLRRRGQLALHASCVVVDGRAAAIVGPSSMGKSSLAAACLKAGDVVIADDVVALKHERGAWHAEVGSNHLRLDERSIAHVVPDLADSLELVGPGWDKWMLPLTRFGAQLPGCAVPLGGVFSLESNSDGVPPNAERMTELVALRLLLPHTSSSLLLQPADRAVEFAAVSGLVASVPVWHLRAPVGFAQLAGIREALRSAMRSGDTRD